MAVVGLFVLLADVIYRRDAHVQDSDQSPWLFLTSPRHDAGVYGYRSVILETVYPSRVTADAPRSAAAAAAAADADDDDDDDDDGPVHRVCVADETMFTTLVCSSGHDDDDDDDFHRRYRPFHRLVVAAAAASRDLSRDQSGAASRDCSAGEVALRLGRDDMRLVRRRLARKSSIGNLPAPTLDIDFDL